MKQSLTSGRFKQKNIIAVPGLTGPILLEAPLSRRCPNTITWLDVPSFFAEIFKIGEWRDLDPVACFMLAAYTAVIAQPVVFGNLGTSIFALMTPLK